METKAINGFVGVAGRCSGAFILEEDLAVVRIHTNVNGILLENLPEGVRAIHGRLRIGCTGHLVEQIDLKGAFGGGESAVNRIVRHSFYLLC